MQSAMIGYRSEDYGVEKRIRAMSQIMFGDLFIIDIANGGMLVSAVAPKARMELGGRFFWSLPETLQEEMLRYLKSYESSPAIFDTPFGLALVFPYLMLSATLAMVYLPYMERRRFLILAARDSIHTPIMSDELRKEGTGRLHDPEGRDTKQYTEFMNRIRACYEFSAHPVLPRRIDGIFEERIDRLSELLGCPVFVRKREPVKDYGEIDMGHFLAVITVVLALARDSLPERSVTISIEERSYGCSVAVLLDGFSFEGDGMEAVFWIDELASRKRTVFEYTRLPDGLHLRFSPISKDWALLELKQDPYFCWD